MEVATFHPPLFISGLSNVDVIIWLNLIVYSIKKVELCKCFFFLFQQSENIV